MSNSSLKIHLFCEQFLNAYDELHYIQKICDKCCTENPSAFHEQFLNTLEDHNYIQKILPEANVKLIIFSFFMNCFQMPVKT